ncbi:hypothetical protein DL93DRAFT_702243 [Clavulina sp. PMI_390]|nr:hypothetical protein DL93DRAFT_702243 [Clavulina sp. PMI_390]
MWNELNESDVEEWVKEAAARGDPGPVTWNVLNRYARLVEYLDKEKDERIGLTLFVWHANGMHKELETYEPALRRLVTLCDASQGPVRIDEVWSFDAADTGDAAIVNAGKMEDYADWVDDARDLLSFIDNYLPSNFAQSNLPIYLPRMDSAIIERRKLKGVEERSLVRIGHSFGGRVLANAACRRPNIFRSLTLIDPVLFRDWAKEQTFYILGALCRRAHWASREEAKELLRKRPVFMS